MRNAGTNRRMAPVRNFIALMDRADREGFTVGIEAGPGLARQNGETFRPMAAIVAHCPLASPPVGVRVPITKGDLNAAAESLLGALR